jgi:hypothetical protein
MTLEEPLRRRRPFPSAVGSAPLLLDEVGDDFFEKLAGERAEESEPTPAEVPSDDADAM